MNSYRVSTYRWEGGEIRARSVQTKVVWADHFEVEPPTEAGEGYLAKFFRENFLVAAFTGFDSVELIDPDEQ